MAFGIIIFESFGRYYSFLMGDDSFYDGMVESYKRERTNVICGRKDIPNKEIDEIADEVSGILIKLNGGENLNLKGLESALNSQ